MAKTFMLTYAYVPEMTDRRGAHRAAHLAHLEAARERGLLLLAGAYADPVDGALLVCEADHPGQIYAWLADDPYNAAGLIRATVVREINVGVAR
ncbi:MAG: YciI family protein [Chloroflexota bacterium]